MPYNSLLSIAAILLILNISSCSRCPKDEKLGEVNLQAASLDWLPYQGSETLVFINQDNEEIKFVLSTSNDWNAETEMVVDVPCSKGSFLFPKEQLLYYDRETYQLYPHTGQDQRYSLIYHLRVYQVDDLPGQDTLLADYLEASAQFDTYVANIFAITDTRNNPEITAGMLDDLSNIRYIGDTILMEKAFQNVHTNLRTSGSNTHVYFSTEQGFVGVSTPEDSWVLDRIE